MTGYIMKLSIIIPFYNEEELIKRTLNNLKQLERNDIEIIFIDDGSNDNTATIINDFELKNSKLISLKHKGVSAARNVGIARATGKYILFMDADDTLETDIIPFFLKSYNKNYDLIKYGYNFVTSKNKQKAFKLTESSKVITNIDPEEFYTTGAYNHIWNLIIKKSLLLDNNIKFNEHHAYAEDYEFNRHLIKYINSIFISNHCFYNYHYNKKSVTESNDLSKTLKNISDALDVYKVSLEECSNSSYLNKAIKHYTHEIGVTIIKLLITKDINFREILNCLVKIRQLPSCKTFNAKINESHIKVNLIYQYTLLAPHKVKISLIRIYYLFKFFLKRKIY